MQPAGPRYPDRDEVAELKEEVRNNMFKKKVKLFGGGLVSGAAILGIIYMIVKRE